MSFLSTLVRQDAHHAYYAYDREGMYTHCQQIVALHSPMFQSRYAMKANHNPEIMHLIRDLGIWLDCCSEYEIDDAIHLGFDPHHVQISSQQCPSDWARLYTQGVDCVVTSLGQLHRFGQQCPGSHVGIRINPGQGSGQFAKINTGGKQSSFGIWHEYLPQVIQIAHHYHLSIDKLHIHIGSGADTQIRLDILGFCLTFMEQIPSIKVLNMGGGFKVARMPEETNTDLVTIIKKSLKLIGQRTENNRELKLEIEPGSYLVANYGYIVCQVDDIVDTGRDGYCFVRTTTGMDMILRPTMYGAQHPLYHFSHSAGKRSDIGDHHYVFVGHCCESSDILTPMPGNPNIIHTRGFDQSIEVGDMIVIGGAGAYCESMRCRGYNGYQ